MNCARLREIESIIYVPEECLAERQVSLCDGGEVGAEAAQLRVDHGVAEAEGGGGEDVGDGGVLGGVVAAVGPDLRAHPLLAEDGGQPVREGDVLHLDAHLGMFYTGRRGHFDIQYHPSLCT